MCFLIYPHPLLKNSYTVRNIAREGYFLAQRDAEAESGAAGGDKAASTEHERIKPIIVTAAPSLGEGLDSGSSPSWYLALACGIGIRTIGWLGAYHVRNDARGRAQDEESMGHPGFVIVEAQSNSPRLTTLDDDFQAERKNVPV
ncbi:predicted protein [Uncinocarpus reesii 1704]|uniref:Uncharacterized protein n=1 Tax=Uncinocarpus reesii (strain UAMH 1704) TaxID=336963 RepID=C4JPH7_UNCRE|nr:uncharacterized protein UREG_03149 [Uncinocarpus reesii 1704]EEP78303.1 predicted protein [Uncinocarpus reesii 1704]